MKRMKKIKLETNSIPLITQMQIYITIASKTEIWYKKQSFFCIKNVGYYSRRENIHDPN